VSNLISDILGSKYETLFDAQEYEAFKKKRKAAQYMKEEIEG